MEQVPDVPGKPLGRLGHLPPTFTGSWWYADYPEHYAGDAGSASEEKGEALMRWQVDTLAAYIAAVKSDQTVPALEAEFFERMAAVGRD
jgi:creatinine amidohydrolase